MIEIQNGEKKLKDTKKSLIRYKNIKHDKKMLKLCTGVEKAIFKYLVK